MIGLFGFVNKAQAFISLKQVSSVPVSGSGGGFDRTEGIGNIAVEELNETAAMHEIVRSAAIAAMNSALKVMSRKFTTILEQKLGVKNFLFYQQSLVEGKYLVDSLRKTYGEQAVSYGANCPYGDVSCLMDSFENLPLNKNFSTAEVARQAVAQRNRQNSQQFAQNIQKLIVGATAAFTSSISCAGVDQNAIRNASTYLAAASAGLLPSDIRPDSGVKFYEDMARLGNPFALPDFWVLQFQSLAAQKEAEAKQAAALELTSPGLKSTQNIGPGGRTQIERSLSLVTIGEQNAQNSLFNIAIKGADSVYDTSSFRNFIISLAQREATRVLAAKLAGLLGKFGGALGLYTNAANITAFQITAEATAKSVASLLVTTFTAKLYDHISGMIFQGQILAESPGCRQPRKIVNFTADDYNYSAATSTAIGSGGGPGTGSAIIFEAGSPITRGQSTALVWDASAAGADVTVTLSGGSINETVEASGSRTDSPTDTTTYTLTVTGPNINETLSRTVTVNEAPPGPDFSKVLFDVRPRTVEPGDEVTVDWDATAVEGASVFISPLSADTLSPSGSAQYTVNQDIPFTMVVSVSNESGQFADTRTISVQVKQPVKGASHQNFNVRE